MAQTQARRDGARTESASHPRTSCWGYPDMGFGSRIDNALNRDAVIRQFVNLCLRTIAPILFGVWDVLRDEYTACPMLDCTPLLECRAHQGAGSHCAGLFGAYPDGSINLRQNTSRLLLRCISSAYNYWVCRSHP